MSWLLKLLNRIYETRFCNDNLLGWTRNVGGILFATRRYDIVTNVQLRAYAFECMNENMYLRVRSGSVLVTMSYRLSISI